MPRTRWSLAVSALLLLMLVAPARAGTEDDPEVSNDFCGPQTVQAAGEYTVCKAWFTASDDADAPPRLTGTVQVAGDLEQRATPVRLALTWSRDDGCREGWRFTDVLEGTDELVVLRQCGSALTTAPLDLARLVLDGADARLELTGEDLARVGSGLVRGARLSRPVAGTRVLVRSGTASIELSTLGGDVGPGRDYVLP